MVKEKIVWNDPSNAYWDLKTGNINAFYSSNKLELTANDLQTPINNVIYVYKYVFKHTVFVVFDFFDF